MFSIRIVPRYWLDGKCNGAASRGRSKLTSVQCEGENDEETSHHLSLSDIHLSRVEQISVILLPPERGLTAKYFV